MQNIKGIIFDYGGTIDTNGIHWAEVIWEQYIKENVNISKELFREAYVHGERTLAKHPIIEPADTFKLLLEKKIAIQFEYLLNTPYGDKLSSKQQTNIAKGCYEKVLKTLSTTRRIVEELSNRYPLVLVTNFYGNMPVVLNEFKLDKYFRKIVESSIVGLRKPDPALFALGVEALQKPANDIVVIGDSYRKDIYPANSLGCKTIWIKKLCWEDESIEAGKEPTAIIDDLTELTQLL